MSEGGRTAGGPFVLEKRGSFHLTEPHHVWTAPKCPPDILSRLKTDVVSETFQNLRVAHTAREAARRHAEAPQVHFNQRVQLSKATFPYLRRRLFLQKA